MSDPEGQWYAIGDAPAPMAYLEYTDASGKITTITFDVVTSEDWPDQGTTVTDHNVEVGADVADHVRVKLATCELKIFSTNEPIWRSSGDNPNTPTQQGVPLYLQSVHITQTPQVLNFNVWDNPIELRALIGDASRAIGGSAGSELAGQVGGSIAQSLLAQARAVPMIQAVDAGRTATSVVETVTAQVDVWANPTDYVANLHAFLVELKNSATQFKVVGTKQTMSPMVIESLGFHRDKDTGSGEEITIGFKQLRIVTTQTVPAPQPGLPGAGGKPPANHGGQTPQPVTSVSALSQLVGAAASGMNAMGKALGGG